MTSYTKRRARPIRHRNEPRAYRQLLTMVGVALGFAVVAVLAALGTRPHSPPAAKSFQLAGRPSAVAVASGMVFVADDQTDSVRVLQASTGHQEDVVHVARNPIALTTGGGYLWVAHASGDVTRVSLGPDHRSVRARVGGSITDVAFARSSLWAADLGRGEVLEMNSHLRVLHRVHGVGPVRLAATSDALWMTTRFDQVARLDFLTQRIKRVHVGPGPIGLAAQGDWVWTANSDNGTVTRIDAKRVRVAGRPIRVGRGPVNVVVRHGVVWVFNTDDQSFTKIDTRTGRVVGVPASIGTHVRGVASDVDLWFVGADPSEAVRLSE